MFLTLALVLGILIAPFTSYYLVFLVVIVPVFYFFKILKLHTYLSVFLIFGIGALSYWTNWDYKTDTDIGTDHQIAFCEVEINGITNSAKKKKLSVEVLRSKNTTLISNQLFIYTDKKAEFIIGDILLIEGKLIKFQKPTIPDQFNFEHYYNSHGYLAQIFADPNELVKIGHHKSFNFYIEKLRNHLRRNLDLLIRSSEERGILKALVVGDRQELTKELKTVYVTAGIFHILAVSGLHVGMMYFIIMLFVRIIPNKRAKFTIVILSLFFYACLTGLSTSVIRAGVMFAFFGYATIFQKKTSSINVLFASCFFILIFKPSFVFESGFQLSVSAVLGILLFFRRVENWFTFKYSIFNKVWSLASVSIAAQVLTTPLILYYFHQFPTYFLLINVVAVVLIQFALIFGSLAAGLGEFYGIGSFFAKLSEWICYIINQMAYYVSNWSFSRILGIHIEMQQVFYLLIATLCIYWFIVYKKRVFFYSSCLLMVGFSVVSSKRFLTYSNQDFLAFHKIKTSLVIESVKGKKTVLYYDANKLKEDEIRLTLLNYWSKRNVSIQELKPLKTCFSINENSFMINNDFETDYRLKIRKWQFSVQNKGSIIFDSRSNESLIIMN